MLESLSNLHSGVCAAALLVVIALPAQALAQGEETAQSVNVQIDRATLDSEHGLKDAYAVIMEGAKEACLKEMTTPVLRLSWKACVRRTIKRTIAEIDSSDLRAYHLAQRKRNPFGKDNMSLASGEDEVRERR